MSNWKKIVGSLLKKGADAVTSVKNSVSINLEVDNGLVTENDILKAIEDLPDTPKVIETEIVSEETRILNKELDNTDLVKVNTARTWANLEYVHKPEMSGLELVRIDERMYFTIPVGWTYDDNFEILYWYITFPLDGTEEDVIEFYSPIKIDEIDFPGVS